MARVIGCRVRFDWDFDGNFAEHDESANVVSVNGSMQLAPPEQAITSTQGIVDRCEIELRNVAGRYSPLNTGGALYSLIQNGKAYHAPVTVDMTVNDGANWTRVFTGVAKIPRETGRTHQEIPTVRFDCRSRDELLLQRRMSTSRATMMGWHEGAYTEGQIINAMLTAGGVTGQQVDAGLVNVPWAWLDDESPLEDIWQIAAACGGRFYFDADGVARYENMAHWLSAPHTTSQQTFTPDDWTTFEATYRDGELFDSISVEYASRTAAPAEVIWEPDDPVSVPANGSRTLWADYTSPVATEPQLSYKASWAGTDMSAYVSVAVTSFAQRAKMVFSNTHPWDQVTLYPLRLSASPLVGTPRAEEERNSADHGVNATFFASRGSRNRGVRGNPYVQTRTQAGMLAQFLLDRHESARLFYAITGCLGNPARRPGDRITVNDPSVMSAGREAMVTEVRWRFSGMAYGMDIVAADAASLFKYAGASPGYFWVGTNKLGSADALRGRVFY